MYGARPMRWFRRAAAAVGVAVIVACAPPLPPNVTVTPLCLIHDSIAVYEVKNLPYAGVWGWRDLSSGRNVATVEAAKGATIRLSNPSLPFAVIFQYPDGTFRAVSDPVNVKPGVCV